MRKAQQMRADVRLHDCHGNFLYCVSHAQGNAMVNERRAIAVRSFSYGVARVTRYQEVAGATPSSSGTSMPVITASELLANAGLFGRSQTVRLPEWDTKHRDSKQARIVANDPEMPPEDFIELSQVKIAMWTRIPLTNPKHVAWSAGA